MDLVDRNLPGITLEQLGTAQKAAIDTGKRMTAGGREGVRVRRRYVVEGDVQGVGFRFFTIRLAQRLGIRGWVRNLPNGRVEAVGEGTEEQLAQFEAALRRGPSLASVTNLRRDEILDEREALTSFQLR